MEKISYGKRNFNEIKIGLINYIKQMYPDVIYDFSDSSVGSMLLDINAAVGENLHFNIDRQFQETQLANAQLRRSLLDMAKTNGLNINPRSASVCVVDFKIIVPTLGDDPDPDYLPVLKNGTRVIGNNRIFELRSDIDFSSPISLYGNVNRKIIPVYNENNVISSYEITKSEVVFNGFTKIFKQSVNDFEAKPFYELTLPENDVLEIESIAVVNGTNNIIQPNDSLFYDDDYRFHHVNYLVQDSVFVDSDSINTDRSIKSGKYKKVTKKFIYEFTENGKCLITFGGGDPNVNFYNEYILNNNNINDNFLKMYLNNIATGEKIAPNSTIFVKYKIGGGSQSNIGPFTITEVTNQVFSFNGTTIPAVRQAVINSITVQNQIPAVGGTDQISIETLRNLIKFNNSSQERCVTLEDYKFRTYMMPGKFGRPFRTNVFKIDNKVIISILGITESNKLNNLSTTLLKQNITNYLTKYRMVNDFVEVRDGKIINLGVTIKLYVQNLSDSEMVNTTVNVVADYFDINKQDMNQDIYIGDMIKMLNDITGVVNVIDFKFYNKVGKDYSTNQISMRYSDEKTKEIRLINNTLFSEPDSMFEIKYPERDIKVILMRKNNL